MKKLKKYLKSSDFGVKLLIGSVVVQGFHSFFIFSDLSNFSDIPRIISSAFYATVLSCAILFFIMINKKKVALNFQLFESMINLYYFFKSIVLMLTINQISWLEVIPRSIIAIGIALILPYTIVQYAGSIELIDSMEGDDTKLSIYYQKKFRKEAMKDVLSQVKSMDDIEKLNQKFATDEQL
jgi:hypothetical protein